MTPSPPQGTASGNLNLEPKRGAILPVLEGLFCENVAFKRPQPGFGNLLLKK